MQVVVDVPLDEFSSESPNQPLVLFMLGTL